MSARNVLRRACPALLLALVLLPAVAPAQNLLIRGATVHTLTERGTLERADVRVRGSRIAEVGTGLAAEPGVEVIEAQGRPLTPGLFGGITGLGIEEIELEPATVDASVLVEDAPPTQEFAAWPEFDVTVGFNPDSVAIGVNRVEGITYAMVAPRGAILAGQGSVARLDGRADAFPAASRTLWSDLGADATEDGGRNRAAQFMLLEQAVREARPGATMRDTDFRVLTPTGREVLARYLAGGRIAFAVDRAADIRQVLRFAQRVGARAIIVGGAQAWQVAGELVRARVPVILDPLVDLPESFDHLGATLENAARLQRAGVQIAFTHFVAPTNNAHKVRQAAGVAVANGLPWDAALAALTTNPAAIFGLGAEIGRVAPGYAADLVLWSADPLEVTSVAEQVWIDGRAQPMRSRQTELRDRYRPHSP